MAYDQSTDIKFQEVRTSAEEILKCSKVMSNIFESFEAEMKEVGADDVFTGNASESLATRFSSLKGKFDGYTNKVKEFSNTIIGAADATEQTDNTLSSAAENLNV